MSDLLNRIVGDPRPYDPDRYWISRVLNRIPEPKPYDPKKYWRSLGIGVLVFILAKMMLVLGRM